MRLIDADALKEHIQANAKIYAEVQFPIDVIIDNAPTISPFKPMCKAKDEAICEEMTTDGHCNYSKPCPNKEERPHIIDNCDMNVFDPEKYMEGSAE